MRQHIRINLVMILALVMMFAGGSHAQVGCEKTSDYYQNCDGSTFGTYYLQQGGNC